MNLFHDVAQGDAPEKLKLIVEISRGDANKYEFNKDLGCLELDRVLYGPMVYPTHYCDVPQTWNEGDHDPLDAVLFSTHPIVPGVLATGRVIGMMEMTDDGEDDAKIICVNDKDPRFAHVNHVDDLTEYQKKDLRTFMETYKIPQKDRLDVVQVGEFLGPEKAYELIKVSQAAYTKKFAN